MSLCCTIAQTSDAVRKSAASWSGSSYEEFVEWFLDMYAVCPDQKTVGVLLRVLTRRANRESLLNKLVDRMLNDVHTMYMAWRHAHCDRCRGLLMEEWYVEDAAWRAATAPDSPNVKWCFACFVAVATERRIAYSVRDHRRWPPRTPKEVLPCPH